MWYDIDRDRYGLITRIERQLPDCLPIKYKSGATVGGWNNMIYNNRVPSDDEVQKLLRSEARWEFDGNERDFEENVFEHLEEICEGLGLPTVTIKDRQRRICYDGSQVIIDIIARHDDDSATIFEVKKAGQKHPQTAPHLQMQSVGQLLLYRTLFSLKTGVEPRLVLIDNKIHRRTLWAFVGGDLPITVVELQKDRVFVPYKTF